MKARYAREIRSGIMFGRSILRVRYPYPGIMGRFCKSDLERLAFARTIRWRSRRPTSDTAR